MRDLEQRTENLARSEVLGNQSALVSWMLSTDLSLFDHITNTLESAEEAADREGWEVGLHHEDQTIFYNRYTRTERAFDEDDLAEAWAELVREEGIEQEPVEVLEWWWIGRAGSFLARDLEEIGAVLLTHPETDDVWWGRTESGQSLAYDSDLREVVRRLEART